MVYLSRFLVLVAFAPFLLWLAALGLTFTLTGLADCVINAGAPKPCTVVGADLSGLAYSAGLFSAWGLLLAMPVFIGAGILWFIVEWLRNNHW